MTMILRIILLLALASSCAYGRTRTVFKADSEAQVNELNSMRGAVKEFSADKLGEGQKGWLKVKFPGNKYSLVYYAIPRSDFIYFDGDKRPAAGLVNLAAPENIWLGYDELQFDYFNPQPGEVELKLWIIDFIALASKCGFNELISPVVTKGQPEHGQMGEVLVKLKPGKNTAIVNLRDEIPTVDKERVIDLSDVRALALCVEEKDVSLSFDNFRLQGKSEKAGELVQPPYTVICKKHAGKGYHDPYAPICTFCAMENADKKPLNLNEGKNSAKVYPDNDCSVGPRGGGGNDTLKAKDNGLTIHHYDDSFWEGRGYLSFNLAEPAAAHDLKKIEKAELRLYRLQVGKPFHTAFQIYSIADKYKIDEKTMTWLSQPPVEEFLFQSGIYSGDAGWVVCDISDYAKRQAAKGKTKMEFSIRANMSASTFTNPHPLGHCSSFVPKESTNNVARPCLYLEFKE